MKRRALHSQEEVDKARLDAIIHVLPTDLDRGETAAFDVVVSGMGMPGRWSQKGGAGGAVTWTSGETFETGACGLDPAKIEAAVRETIPYRVEEARSIPRRMLDRLRNSGIAGADRGRSS